jgi:hypothetical protein
MAWPMSPKVLPGFTASIPLNSASWVTWISRSALRELAGHIHAAEVSPNQPSTITVTSMFRISPAFSTFSRDAVADHVVHEMQLACW